MNKSNDLSTTPSNVDSLLAAAMELYASTYGSLDTATTTSTDYRRCASYAPGRVNLIGEHVDYTGGFVMPMAIGYGTVCYGTGRIVVPNESVGKSRGRCRMVSLHGSMVERFTSESGSWSAIPDSNDPQFWSNYVLGTVMQYLPPFDAGEKDKGQRLLEFDLAIAGDVPLGAGLSSSASLEVAVARWLESLLSTVLDPIERAVRCLKSDREFCGYPCGIMDQYVCSAAVADAALLIDCRSRTYEPIPLPSATIVVCDSGVQHSNASGEYPVRVRQCTAAETVLGTSLRDATPEEVEAARAVLSENDEAVYRRALHATSENSRTLAFVESLKKGDLVEAGQRMNESHDSLRDLYEVSCPEVDELVQIAQSVPGTFGSRMTGGGFGGCTVTLITQEAVPALMKAFRTQYSLSNKEKDSPRCFVTSACGGARELNVP